MKFKRRLVDTGHDPVVAGVVSLGRIQVFDRGGIAEIGDLLPLRFRRVGVVVETTRQETGRRSDEQEYIHMRLQSRFNSKRFTQGNVRNNFITYNVYLALAGSSPKP